jgi:spore coat protein U-like protein
VQGGTNAQAEISQGCYIERVTPLNFGTLTSTATLRPTRSTATLTTRCPAGTAFTLAMGKGNHASGNQRQLCNNEGQCLRYGLWQDAGATQSWGDQTAAMRCRSPIPLAAPRTSPFTAKSRHSPERYGNLLMT